MKEEDRLYYCTNRCKYYNYYDGWCHYYDKDTCEIDLIQCEVIKKVIKMTENNRFIKPNKECRVIKNTKTGETATYYDTEDGLMFLKWLNNLSNENEQLKERLKLNCPNIVWRDLE